MQCRLHILLFICLFVLTGADLRAEVAQKKSSATPSLPVKEASAMTKPAEKKTLGKDPVLPTDVIKAYEAEVKAIVHKYKGADQKAVEKEQTEQIAMKVRRFFDFRYLARLSIRDHWKKQSWSNRQKFVSLFTQLIERSYLKKTQKLIGDYAVTYGEEKIEGKNAQVVSKIEQGDVDVDVIYQLRKKKKSWVIYNVIFDNLNLANNYRSQFNRIISKKSFKELLRIMEDKLAAAA